MTVKCSKCGGYIPDVSYGSGIDVRDCKNHIKPQTDFTHLENLKLKDKEEPKPNLVMEYFKYKNKEKLCQK
jgi:hypothetical protein